MKSAVVISTLALVLGSWSILQADHHLKPVDFAGVWKVKADTDDGGRDLKWVVKEEEGKLAGVSIDNDDGNERTFDRISIKEKKVVLEIDIEWDGNKGIIRVEVEEKTSGKLVGEWSIVGDDDTEYMSGDISAIKEVAFAGEWKSISELPDGSTHESVLQLKGKNATLKGLFEGDTRETEVDEISVKGRSLRLEFDFELGGNQIDCVIEAEAKGDDKLEGTWVVFGEDGGESAKGDWSAVRKRRGLAGVWDVVAVVPDSDEYNGTITLSQKDGKYSGSSKGSSGTTTKMSMVKFDGTKFEYSVPFDQDGYKGTIAVKAKRQEDGSLKGEWSFTSEDGSELARESWKATRR